MPAPQTVDEPSWRQRLMQRLEELFRDMARHVNEPVPFVSAQYGNQTFTPSSSTVITLTPTIDASGIISGNVMRPKVTGVWNFSFVMSLNISALVQFGLLLQLKKNGAVLASFIGSGGFVAGVGVYTFQGSVTDRMFSDIDSYTFELFRDSSQPAIGVTSFLNPDFNNLAITRIGHLNP